MSGGKKAIIVFIKNPELGKVKTRLASTLGDEMALKIYKSLMAHTRAIVLSTPAKRLLFYSEWINQEDEWSAENFEKHLQEDGDLGDRICQAFKTGFTSADRVVIVGSDCPGLSEAIISQAFEALEQDDFVIGPALDGGYYLLGMNAFHPELFQNITWSSEKVRAQTESIIQSLGKTVKALVPLSDIDFAEDWEQYGWQLSD